tara:strand:- start:40 stop:270 length:231 start_codon:yes stop_codon:yes gene_type:complete
MKYENKHLVVNQTDSSSLFRNPLEMDCQLTALNSRRNIAFFLEMPQTPRFSSSFNTTNEIFETAIRDFLKIFFVGF